MTLSLYQQLKIKKINFLKKELIVLAPKSSNLLNISIKIFQSKRLLGIIKIRVCPNMRRYGAKVK